MSELLSAYKITIKVGDKLFAGHVDNSLTITPNYEPILKKTLMGAFDLEFLNYDLALGVSGLMYKRTAEEAATHNDYADLRAACDNVTSVAFVYGEITPGEYVISGNAKLSEYQETAGSGKSPGRWSCKLKSIRGSVQETQILGVVKYGLLYNWYAVSDAKNIAASGWHVSTRIEWVTLSTYLGGDNVAGGKLKETGTSYWTSPNTGATNEVAFYGRGSGLRGLTGTFNQLKSGGYFWTSYSVGGYPTLAVDVNIGYNRASIDTLQSTERIQGMALRPIKDSTTLSHGQTGIYTGNDLRTYPTICIGTQELLACNLAETKFRTGEAIPEVTENAAWAALTTAGMCAYNNDHSNI